MGGIRGAERRGIRGQRGWGDKRGQRGVGG